MCLFYKFEFYSSHVKNGQVWLIFFPWAPRSCLKFVSSSIWPHCFTVISWVDHIFIKALKPLNATIYTIFDVYMWNCDIYCFRNARLWQENILWKTKPIVRLTLVCLIRFLLVFICFRKCFPLYTTYLNSNTQGDLLKLYWNLLLFKCWVILFSWFLL